MTGSTRTPIPVRLDNSKAFGSLRGTRYNYDVVYQKFSPAEMARRYQATRDKMARLGLDALIAPGGPNHWSFGGGMRWLTNHWEWHAMACYVLVPMQGDPTLVYSMGGSHIEAVRRAVVIDDVRHSRNGKFGDVLVERLKELRLEKGRIGITEADPRFHDNLPENQYRVLREGLPDADFKFVGEFFHELLLHKSPEELECIRRAGEMTDMALRAMIARGAPGVAEYQLAAAAAGAVLDAGGQIDFLIVGATPMSDPAMVFGNPHPSERRLQKGDLILNELAIGYRGYTAQIGVPFCLGKPTDEVQSLFDDVTLPGYLRLEALLRPGVTYENFRQEGQWFKAKGYQSRPTLLHGMDFVTSSPHIVVDEVRAEPYETAFEPEMTVMLEPNPITPDGNLGIFLGQTYIITEDGHERVTKYPLELTVV